MKSDFWRWLGLICLAAFLLIALFFNQITQYVPHSEDEVAYLFQAKIFALNRLSVPTPAHADAFWSPFVVDFQGQRFGKYPPGWPLLLSLGVRLGAPWLANTVLAALTLALVAWLGRCLYGPAPGLWAAALGLVTPAFMFLSGSYLSHAASLFWSTTTLIFLFYLIEKPQKLLFAMAAGFSLGLVFITRPFAALGLGLPIGLFLWVCMGQRTLRWTMPLWMIAGGLPAAILLPAYWWGITGTPAFNAYLLVWPYDRIGFGPDIGPYGYDLYTTIFVNTRLKLQMLSTNLFGWPGWTNVIFLPVPFIARWIKRGDGVELRKTAGLWDWLLLGIIGGMVGVHTFYWAFGGADGGIPRYYYDALPAFLLLTVRGIQICFDCARNWRWGPLRAGWILAAILAGFVAYNFFWTLPPLLAAQQGKYDITPAPLRVVEQANLTEPALIIVKNATDWHKFAAPFTANSPLLDGPVVYAIDWNPALTQQVREQFQDRACWELDGSTLTRCP